MFGSRNFLFARSAGASGTGLWSWGNNSYGQLGLGNTTTYYSPKQVGTLFDWDYPTIGGITNHSVLCTKTDGTLWAWGNNSNGCLGLGNETNRSSPVQVGALTTWSRPSAVRGYSSLCLKTDGTLWSWGSNVYGQLGLGNTTVYSSPKQIGNLTNWSKLTTTSTTNSVLCVKTDGTLWAWGRNAYGQLGQGNTTSLSSPVQVGALTDWAIPAMGFNALCVKTNGTLWSWGSNFTGELGLGDTVARSSPVQIGALTTWSKPSTGNLAGACVKTDGTLWMWGYNNWGNLGLGDAGSTNRSSPVQVGSLTTWSYVKNGWNSTVGVTTDGTLFTWGRNDFGQLGLGNTTNFSSPVQVGSSITWQNPTVARTTMLCTKQAATSAPSNVSVPVVTGATTVGSTLTSTTGTWNNDPYSFTFQWQRGTSNISGATSSTYVIVSADVGSTLRCVVTATNAIGATAANSANTATVTVIQGQLWNWGANSYGSLGQNNVISRSSPVQVGSSTDWTYSAMGGYASLAVNSLGQLWAWGYNDSGRLGLGDTVNRSSPVQVGALTTWQKVFNAQGLCCAIKTDGTLWSWGRNINGQLGLGNTTNYSSPKQIGGSTNWVTASVGGVSGGTFAINSLGELWATGNNTTFGQLGLNDTTNRSSLTQVPGADWKNVFAGVSTCHAIKTDGTLWGWGRANDGVIGNNSTVYRSSPVQIGSDTNWSNVRKTSNYSTAAVKTDGTLWAWGSSSAGQLGQNDVSPKRSSPVQVGALTTWVRVTNAGPYGCLARKTDGTLWSWGSNNTGSLGLGDIDNRSSPVQIGALTTWVINGFGATSANSSAIKTP